MPDVTLREKMAPWWMALKGDTTFTQQETEQESAEMKVLSGWNYQQFLLFLRLWFTKIPNTTHTHKKGMLRVIYKEFCVEGDFERIQKWGFLGVMFILKNNIEFRSLRIDWNENTMIKFALTGIQLTPFLNSINLRKLLKLWNAQ